MGPNRRHVVQSLALLAAGRAVGAPRAEAPLLPPAVARAIADAGLPPASFGLFAQAVDGDRVFVRLNAERPYTMASTTKIVTSLAALDLLGPYYRWHTSAYAMGPVVDGRLRGDLLIVGGGDAQLTSAALQAWFGRMRAQGLAAIEGDIVLDRFAFHLSVADHAHTPVQSAFQPRHVWPDALTLDEGLLTVALAPGGAGRAALALQPPLEDVRLVDALASGGGCDPWAQWHDGRAGQAEIVVRGHWRAACGVRSVSFVPPPDSGYAARALARMWTATGGELRGRVVSPERPLGDSAVPRGVDGEPLRPLSFVRSKPLTELVRDINKVSDNVGARNLMLSLSPGFPERAATLAGARKIMRMWLAQQGLAPDDIEIENGSGLSHTERARPQALVQLLRQGWHAEQAQAFVASLPVAGIDGTLAHRLQGRALGQAFLKTGTLNDTVALAGYVRGASGATCAIAFMVVHPEASRGRGAIDAMVEWLVRNW